MVLENGLKCLVVCDADADRAACALQVAVGSMHEPRHWCGLAHFLEHCLFLGTRDWPRENEYSQYLAQNGGHSNAYTSGQETNYYFECNAADGVLPAAVDRFSAFFKCPLLGHGVIESESSDSSSSGVGGGDAGKEVKENAVQREMKAVDSEFKKNLQNDYWRIQQVYKSECNPAHPYSSFDIGNLETLQRAGIMDALRDFHARAYSADLMALVLVGKEPMSQLVDLVVKHFAAVPRVSGAVEFRQSAIPPGHPCTADTLLGKMLHARPLKDTRKLSIDFALPGQLRHKWHKPSSYLSHLVGHEADGSLLEHLK